MQNIILQVYILGQMFQKGKKSLARANQNSKTLFIFSRVGIIVIHVYLQTTKLYIYIY